MPNRIAVIDLGTNTFHILIAEAQADHSFKDLHRQRFFVKLAEEGIETIGKAPLDRGFKALTHFKNLIEELQVTKVKAIGTAALRTATNGPTFVQEVKDKLGFQIELISGHQEASFIHKGVTLAVPFQEQNYLLMDIGGGSVEFIIANKNQVHWAQSFPIGVGVLYKKFHKSNPISDQEIIATNTYIKDYLAPLRIALQKFPATTLVGASGTFDVLESLLAKKITSPTHAYVAVEDFSPLYERIIKTTETERYEMQTIPDNRADMIVVALILIDYILKNVAIDQIIVSKYAMKEGIMVDLLQTEITSMS